MADRFYLARFKNAHEFGLDGSGYGTYEQALAEVKAGHKTSHWMWYIFPQIAGFGHSHNTKFYAIKSKEEAQAYLEDEVLGPRIREICEALLTLETNDPAEVFGFPDWMKLGSSMTLFDDVCPNNVFGQVLDKLYDGKRDLITSLFISNERGEEEEEDDSTGILIDVLRDDYKEEDDDLLEKISVQNKN